MLSVITGKQRAGKTYYCVKEIIFPVLNDSKRHVFTNLPINPDYLVRYMSRNLFEHSELMSRIHIFMDTSFFSLREFQRKNPMFFRHFKENIISDKNIKSFWEHVKENSVIIFDEIYEYFSSTDYLDKSEKNVDLRKKLLSVSRQHGHFKQDIFLVSHSYQDLDSFIKRGIQYLYVVRNSKYTNIVNSRWFTGLKWPVQFFIVEGFEFGEKSAADRFFIPSKKEIFRCYNSFSNSRVVGRNFVNDKTQSSTDYNQSIWVGLRKFFRQFKMTLIFFTCLILGVFFCFKAYLKMAMAPIQVKYKNENIDKSKAVAENNVVSKSEKPLSAPVEKKDQKEKTEEIKVKLRTDKLIKYSNGISIRVGELYKGYQIEKIDKDFVYCTDASGKRFKCSHLGVIRE
ncbi:MAG TPA: hypothetical protein DCZ94_04480 [Lentisphaeria bacterium]|nr:MAG: hypothetical protein A2X48_20290 [Lentisphaerae bacterium GWF2_49_21]HBC86193.1 hypothetical protein [Lentisphaeria bacterium]